MLGLRRIARAGSRASSSLAAATPGAVESSYVTKAVATYRAAQATVDQALVPTLEKNKYVLFMEGTADAPASQQSLNVIKMLTESQCVPLTVVDTLEHPAILGFTASRSQKGLGPHLYVDNTFVGDHDALLRKYQAGGLPGTGAKSSGTFGG